MFNFSSPLSIDLKFSSDIHHYKIFAWVNCCRRVSTLQGCKNRIFHKLGPRQMTKILFQLYCCVELNEMKQRANFSQHLWQKRSKIDFLISLTSGLLKILSSEFLLIKINCHNSIKIAQEQRSVSFGKTFDEVTRKLQNNILILDKWFFNNLLVLNSDKCYFMTLVTPNALRNFKCKDTTKQKQRLQKTFRCYYWYQTWL